MRESGGSVFGTVVSKNNFDKICRCCLSPEPSGSVFELMHEETPLFYILNSLFGIQLDPEDALPKKICETCIGEVTRCYNFKRTYEASEATLLNSIAIKEEDVDAEIKEEPLRDNFEELEPIVIDKNEKGIESELAEIKFNENLVTNGLDSKKQRQSKVFTCSCEESFPTKSEFRQHREVTNHHMPRTHPCKICGKLFPQRGLWRHLKIHEAVKPYSCDRCEARFAASGNLQRHILVHTGEKPHVCDICGKGFIQLDSMQAHRRIHTGEKPYTCALCGRGFRNKRSYTSHIQDHDHKTFSDPTKKIECKECGRVCHGQHAHKLHLYKRHGSGEEQVEGDQYQCDICKKFYGSQSSLTFHMQCHNEKNFLCNKCGKVFHKKSTLETHYLSHTGEKPFACEFCDKRFAQQPSLQRHRFVHTGERPYACALCPKKFRQSAHLNRHLTVHTGERPYVCTVCDKSYPQKESLNIHLRMHTGEKAFKCDQCTSMFYDSGSLKKHKQRKHQQKSAA